MRIYIWELEVSPESSPQDLLRAELFQAIAMVNLLLKGWCEPPIAGSFHFSTLIQQVLSMVCQYGAIDALRTWRVLCETGPFSNISSSVFISLLRAMGAHNLISQSSDGTLVLGWQGERLVNDYDFYSAFTSPEEYKLFAEDMQLGTMPMLFPPTTDMFLIFAGRLWVITDVNVDMMTIFLIPAKTGKPPKFFGTGAVVSDEVRKEMFRVYNSRKMPNYLDSTAIRLFTEGVDFFDNFGLSAKTMLSLPNGIVVFPWRGDRIVYTLHLLLVQRGLKVEYDGVALTILNTTKENFRNVLKAILENDPVDAVDLASKVPHKRAQKHDCFINDDLLNMEFAAKNLDIKGSYERIRELIQ
jgi:ATP-dependent Lhr-like helicase